LRGNGIPKDQLNVDMFESMILGKSIKIDMQRDFKRVNISRSSKQQQVDNFSILKLASFQYGAMERTAFCRQRFCPTISRLN
jgi:hypothetical protein